LYAKPSKQNVSRCDQSAKLKLIQNPAATAQPFGVIPNSQSATKIT